MNDTKKDEAFDLYVKRGKKPKDIAKELRVPLSNIYRWKKEDAKKKKDWDEQKDLWNLSPAEMEKIYIDSLKEVILLVKNNPKMMLQPGTADAMTKHISNMKKLNPKQVYYGAALDLIKKMDEYLKENAPGLHNELKAHWEEIKTVLQDYIESKQ